MMNTLIQQRTIVQFTCLILLVIFGFGCGGNVEGPGTESESVSAGTITYTELNPDLGIIRGEYAYHDHVIRFDVTRGEETPPEALLVYPGIASHEVSVRICDTEGFCFINGTGGHGFEDTGEVDPSETTPSSERSYKNFESAWSLHGDLTVPSIEMPNGLEEETRALFDATNQPPDTWQHIPPEYDPLNLKPNESSCDGTPKHGVLSFDASGTGTYTHVFQVWRQRLVWPIAYHSSSSSKAFDANGQIIAIFYTCNHGACSNGSDSSMSLYCARNFSNRSDPTFPTMTRCADSARIGTPHPDDGPIGCCESPYSYIPLTLSHVCNDDTRLQRDMMIANGPVIASFCADRYLQGQAPYCW